MKYKWIRWIFLMAGIIGIASACAPHTNQSSDEIPLLIGTYTNGNSEGIYSFRFNQKTGKAIKRQSSSIQYRQTIRLSLSLRPMERGCMP